VSGNGGAGVTNFLTGTAVTYAGGGGAGLYSGTVGTGGSGIGGTGATTINTGTATAGVVNTGSGGGGGSTSGAGGSGIVILRIPDIYSATFSAGLSATTSNTAGYRIYSITAGTGTVTFN
jgi:hypothetical protein